MTIYISTPINGRSEATFAEKYAAAMSRTSEITQMLRQKPEYRDATFISTFDLNALGRCSEATAMGRCVQALLESDMIVLDKHWKHSKGCRVEFFVAQVYHIKTISL